MRRIYARLANRQNALELMVEDIVWDLSRRQVEPEVYHGHEGVMRFASQYFEGWSDVEMEPLDFTAAGNRVLVPLEITSRGRSSGLEASEQIAHVWTVSNGKATRLEYFGDLAEAKRALEVEA